MQGQCFTPESNMCFSQPSVTTGGLYLNHLILHTIYLIQMNTYYLLN